MNLNQIHLIGRITQQPESKTLPSGTSVVSFGLATNNVYKNKEGQKTEETDFHNIVAFGRVADTIMQYVVKGQELYVSGRVKYRSWDKKDGTGKAYRTEIIVNTFQFGQKPRGSEGAAPAGVPKSEEKPQEVGTIEYGEEDINPDEIPF